MVHGDDLDDEGVKALLTHQHLVVVVGSDGFAVQVPADVGRREASHLDSGRGRGNRAGQGVVQTNAGFSQTFLRGSTFTGYARTENSLFGKNDLTMIFLGYADITPLNPAPSLQPDWLCGADEGYNRSGTANISQQYHPVLVDPS